MTYIRFIRHGETDWNKAKRIQGWTNIPLNDTGRKQAQQACKRLNDKEWNLLMTSPLSRANETAEILNTNLQLPIETNDNLRERCYGKVEGMLRDERVRLYPNGEYPEAESRSDVIQRIERFLQFTLKNHHGKNIIVTTHGGVVNALLTMLTNGELGFDRTSIKNVSFTSIEYVHNIWQIHSYNETSER